MWKETRALRINPCSSRKNCKLHRHHQRPGSNLGCCSYETAVLWVLPFCCPNVLHEFDLHSVTANLLWSMHTKNLFLVIIVSALDLLLICKNYFLGSYYLPPVVFFLPLIVSQLQSIWFNIWIFKAQALSFFCFYSIFYQGKPTYLLTFTRFDRYGAKCRWYKI